MRSKRKIAGVIVGALVLLVAGSFAVLHTTWWRNRLRAVVTERLSTQFRGTVQIGRIDAMDWNSVSVSNLTVTLDADTIAIVPSLRVGLETRSLLSKQVAIGKLEVDSLVLRLRKAEDGRWNLAAAFAPANSPTVSDDTRDGGGDWTVGLAGVVIRGGRAVIDLEPNGSRPPLRVTGFDLRGDFSYDPDKIRIRVAELHGALQEPSLVLDRCSGVLQCSDGLWTLDELELATPANSLRGHGTWSVRDDSSRRFELTTAAVDFSEFATTLGMKTIAGHPALHAKGEFRAGALHFELEASEGDAHLALEGRLDSRTRTYSAQGTLQEIVLDRWIPATLPPTRVHGTFHVDGSDLGRSWLPANGRVALSRSMVDRFHVDSLTAMGSMRTGEVSASIRLDADFGAVKGTLALTDPTGTQRFVTEASFQGLEPRKFAPRLPADGRLNGRLRLRGSGLTIPTFEGEGTIELVSSHVGPVAVDSVRSELRYAHRELQVDRLWAAAPAGEVRLSGRYAISGAFEVRGSADLENVAALPLDLGGKAVGGAGHIDLDVSGSPDSIVGRAAFEIVDALYGTIAADKLDGRFTVQGAPKISTAQVALQADSLRIGKVAFATAAGSGTYDRDRMSGALTWDGDRIPSGSVDFDASLRPTLSVSLPRIELDAGGTKWTGASGPIAIDPSRQAYAVDAMELRLDGGRVRLSGAASGDRITQAEIFVTDLELKSLAAAFDSTLVLSGRVDGSVKGSGSLTNPAVEGRLEVTDASYRGSQVQVLRIDGTYADSRLASNVALLDSARSDLRLRLDLPLAPPGRRTEGVLDPNGRVEISMTAEGHDLSWLSGLVGASVRGSLSSDLSLSGSTDQPQLHGALTLAGGAVEDVKSGLRLDGIAVRASGRGRELLLDSLSVGSETRRLRGRGAVVVGKGILKGGVDSLRLSVDANKFQVLARKKLDLAVDSHLDLAMHAKQVTVNGNVDLVRSKIYLPAIIGAVPTAKPADLPLLVVATAPPDTVLVDTTVVVKRNSELYRDARGKVRVTIPEGTWLTGHILNVEIAGAVDVVKTGPDAELFGIVEVKRGTCTVLGKSFRMEISEVEFKGGPKLDPLLRLSLLYEIRTPTREKKELRLEVGGVASSPEIRFMIEEKEITQADALSYIVLGQSQDELTVSQQSSLGGENNRLGTNMAADVLAAQMSSMLARSAGMDVVELKGDENWSKASLTAGKYVGQDLYLSYEKGFGDYDSDETAPKIFTAEYELIRSLFLQLVSGNESTSGVDLILIIKR